MNNPRWYFSFFPAPRTDRRQTEIVFFCVSLPWTRVNCCFAFSFIYIALRCRLKLKLWFGFVMTHSRWAWMMSGIESTIHPRFTSITKCWGGPERILQYEFNTKTFQTMEAAASNPPSRELFEIETLPSDKSINYPSPNQTRQLTWRVYRARFDIEFEARETERRRETVLEISS